MLSDLYQFRVSPALNSLLCLISFVTVAFRCPPVSATTLSCSCAKRCHWPSAFPEPHRTSGRSSMSGLFSLTTIPSPPPTHSTRRTKAFDRIAGSLLPVGGGRRAFATTSTVTSGCTSSDCAVSTPLSHLSPVEPKI
uniref:SAM_MT_RSMB_NOP domain-containing protein n=1 Tax=Mesocestoides corti TaxID=53468 RepID=A0A5K3EH03_MESCO